MFVIIILFLVDSSATKYNQKTLEKITRLNIHCFLDRFKPTNDNSFSQRKDCLFRKHLVYVIQRTNSSLTLFYFTWHLICLWVMWHSKSNLYYLKKIQIVRTHIRHFSFVIDAFISLLFFLFKTKRCPTSLLLSPRNLS